MKLHIKANDIFGDWTLIAIIRSSANGEIYACKNSARERKVIKVCKKITSKAYLRFKEEIQNILSSQDLHCVIPVIDYKLPPEPFNNKKQHVPFYVMDEGVEILTYLKDKPLYKKIEFITVLAKTLFDLHEREIYHRDIKPTNMIVINKFPYFIDFGISKSPKSIDITGNNAIGPKYTMAPEVKTATKEERKNLDWSKADVYSFAVTSWIIMTGKERGFEGAYNLSSSIALRKFIFDENLHLLDAALLTSTKISPQMRCGSKELVQHFLKWYNYNGEFLPSKSIQWHNIIESIFGSILPVKSKWNTYGDINLILKKVLSIKNLTHLSLPTGGGMDILRIKKYKNNELIIITEDETRHRFIPKSLEFHSFKKHSNRQYFILKVKKRKKKNIKYSEETNSFQWLFTDKKRETFEGNLIPNISIKKPILECYWFNGSMMLTGKANYMNQSNLNYLGFDISASTKKHNKRLKKLMSKEESA